MKKTDWQYNGEIETVDSCILCESNRSEIDTDFSTRLGLRDPFRCRKCSTCGLRWLSPRPTQKGYELIYTMDNYFGGEHSQESFLVLEKSRARLFRDRLKRIRHIFKASQGEKKTILDIGAATGQFVYEAKIAGYNAIGIELSSEAIEQAQKRYLVNLKKESLQDLIAQEYRFDIIHMNHVFEHFLDPIICLNQCKKLLNANGVLIIEVPCQFHNNLDKLKDTLLMNHKPSFTPYSLHHTYFYTPNTLTMLLRKYGFTICKLRTSNPINTPLWPISFKNIFLLVYLHISDYFKRGNIIEIFSKIS